MTRVAVRRAAEGHARPARRALFVILATFGGAEPRRRSQDHENRGPRGCAAATTPGPGVAA